jgi:hypothetical protein
MHIELSYIIHIHCIKFDERKSLIDCELKEHDMNAHKFRILTECSANRVKWREQEFTTGQI